MPGLLGVVTLAGRLPLPAMQPRQGMARTGRVLAMRDVRAADVRDGGHAVASIQAAVAVVVPGDVVGDKPETRGQRAGLAAGAGVGELPHGMDLAAQAAAGHGTPRPGPAERAGGGGRNVRRRRGSEVGRR